MYDCEICRKKRSCKRKWIFKYCPFCGGKKESGGRKKCSLCKGKGFVLFDKCPRSMERELDMDYYFEWEIGLSNGRIVYPDGQGSLYQPLKLKKAYTLLLNCFTYLRGKKNGNK